MYIYDLSVKRDWLIKHYSANGSLSKAIRVLVKRFPFHGEDLILNFCLTYYPKPLDSDTFNYAIRTNKLKKGTFIPFEKYSTIPSVGLKHNCTKHYFNKMTNDSLKV